MENKMFKVSALLFTMFASVSGTAFAQDGEMQPVRGNAELGLGAQFGVNSGFGGYISADFPVSDRWLVGGAIRGYYNDSQSNDPCDSDDAGLFCLDFDFPYGPGFELRTDYQALQWLRVGARARLDFDIGPDSGIGPFVLVEPRLTAMSPDWVVTPKGQLGVGISWLGQPIPVGQVDNVGSEGDITGVSVHAELGVIWRAVTFDSGSQLELGVMTNGSVGIPVSCTGHCDSTDVAPIELGAHLTAGYTF